MGHSALTQVLPYLYLLHHHLWTGQLDCGSNRPLNYFNILLLYLTGFGKGYPQIFGIFSLFWRVSTFFSFRNYLQSRRYKNIRYASLFFSLLSLPSPFRFSFRWILGLLGHFKNASKMVRVKKSDIFRRYVLSNPVRYYFTEISQKNAQSMARY